MKAVQGADHPCRGDIRANQGTNLVYKLMGLGSIYLFFAVYRVEFLGTTLIYSFYFYDFFDYGDVTHTDLNLPPDRRRKYT